MQDNFDLHDCPGTDAQVTAEDFAASGQPGQSHFQTVDELLDRNDEITGIKGLLSLYPRDCNLEFRFLHPTRTVRYKGCERKLSVSIYRRVGGVLDQPNNLVMTLIEKMVRGYNCYFGVQPRYFSDGTRASTSLDVKRICCFALDFDNVTPGQLDIILKHHNLPRPTLTVNSGYGLHVYHFLKIPLTRIVGAELFNKFVIKHSACQRLNADPACKDVARILRLPGSINMPKGNRPPAHCKIIEANLGLKYDVAELLPECAAEIGDTVLLDFLNEPDQDRLWQEREEGRKSKPDPIALVALSHRFHRGGKPPSTTPLSPPSTATPYTSHRFGGEDVHRGKWDLEYAKAIITQHPVALPGQRHDTALRLLTAIKRCLGQLQDKHLRWVHSQWFDSYHRLMSGATSRDESWADFLLIWVWLWKTNDTSKGNGFFGQLDVVPHPGRHLISLGQRYNRHRQLADVMFTASRNVGFADDKFFLGVKDACAILELSSIESGWRILQALKRAGLVVETIPGSQQTGRAARYTIPERWRIPTPNAGGAGENQ